VGRLYPKVGPRRLVVFGLTGVAVVSAGFLFVGPETNLWWVRAIMFLRGVFMAYSFVPIQASSYANISFADTGRASALLSTQRQVAAALGVAIMATVLTSRTTSLTSALTDPAELADAQLRAFHQSFAVGIVLVVFGAVVALLIRDSDAAATMKPKGSGAPSGAAH
jgi:sugar phosphate permease